MNDVGSVDLYFGPNHTPAEANEAPDSIFRFYGPKPAFWPVMPDADAIRHEAPVYMEANVCF
jgi:hypothetical protein